MSIRCFATMLNNKIYNCIQTMHKVTPYKLFNTKFTIGLIAFVTIGQPFHVNVGMRWGEDGDTQSI